MNTGIFISSCDKYSWAWKAVENNFKKYWKDCPYDIHFVTNWKTPPIGNQIIVGPDYPWATFTQKALLRFPYKYLIFLLEDYWFTEPVNTQGMIQLTDLIASNSDIKHIRLYVSEGSRKVPRFSFNDQTDVLNMNEPYRCSFNAGIWNKEYLYDLCNRFRNNNIWNCEHLFTKDSTKDLMLTVKEMNYIKYDINKNMIERGILTEHGQQYLDKEGIKL